MERTTNLDLLLPYGEDYVNVNEYISGNFQKIDDAFTIEDITSQLTFQNYITVQTGGVYRIGKLIVVQLRVYSDTEQIKAGTLIATSGLPKPLGGLASTSCVIFNCNRLGLSPYLMYDTGGLGILSLSTEVVQTGSAVYINGTYIAE